jgi:hypothetical protein
LLKPERIFGEAILQKFHILWNEKDNPLEAIFYRCFDNRFTIRVQTRNFTSMPYFNWNDSINFLTKLRPRRLWNATKVYASYQVTKLTGKPVQWGYPDFGFF